MSVVPLISPKIFEIAPGFRAISITVLASEIIDSDVATQALLDSYKCVHEDNPTGPKRTLLHGERYLRRLVQNRRERHALPRLYVIES